MQQAARYWGGALPQEPAQDFRSDQCILYMLWLQLSATVRVMFLWWCRRGRAYSDVHKLQGSTSADMDGVHNVVHVQHDHRLVIYGST